MEGIGSYISVIGLSSLFTGDIVIIGMAIILDLAKIVSVSFLYQYWNEVKLTMKYYMTAAVLVLMVITSAGAFGYLSSSFQKAIQPNLEVTLKVDSFTKQQVSLETEKRELTDLKLSINKQIAEIPSANERARRQLIYSMRPELERINSRLEKVNGQLDDVRAKTLAAKGENIEQNVHVGPIVYVSQAFGVSVENASKYIILIIVAVFDPLAIMLILAANMLIKKRHEDKAAVKPEPVIEPPVEPTVDLNVKLTPEPVPLEWPNIPEPVLEQASPTYSDSPPSEFIHERGPTILPAKVEKQGMVLK